MKAIEPGDLVVHAHGLCHLSVCTTLTERAAIERIVNEREPTGIKSRWEIRAATFRCGSPNPCPCDETPGRMHYLLSC